MPTAKPASGDFRRAGVELPPPPTPLGDRWYSKLALLLAAVLLLTLSFAPLSQFYLAWLGLVPWLLLLRRLKSQRAAFLWNWGAGILFFTANMWWLWNVTGPGMVALMFLLGLYWAVAAVILRGVGLVGPVEPVAVPNADTFRKHSGFRATSTVLLIASTWVSFEWIRGNWPLDGLPWLFLGHSQTPALPLCQVADVTGVYGVSFLVAAVNAVVFLAVSDGFTVRRLAAPVLLVGTLLVVSAAYGLFKMTEAKPLTAGPTVLVVQPNYPQDNTGEKGAPADELVDFHVRTTEAALAALPPGAPRPDLVVWSETMMPPLNRAARSLFRGFQTDQHEDYGQFLDATHERIKNLAYAHKVPILVGSSYYDAEAHPDPRAPEGRRIVEDKRNTAYFYDRTGHMSDDPADRYDKIHIVPFGEYLPFRDSLPIAYRLFVALSPYPEAYFLTPGDERAMTAFRLDRAAPTPSSAPTTGPATDAATAPVTAPGAAPAPEEWRFVTPICFEDIDPLLVARMFRPRGDRPANAGHGKKRADFIVNITNDGWFMANEMPQHLQAARFRSIENRAPTARSVNTGISGFIDSCGRVSGLIPAGTEGTSVQTLQLDSRLTLYTRFGDAFAYGCVAATSLAAVAALVRWWTGRRRARGATPAPSVPA